MDQPTPENRDNQKPAPEPTAGAPPETSSAAEEPKILGIRRQGGRWSVDRRGFIAGGVAGAMAGASSADAQDAPRATDEEVGAAAMDAARKLLESKRVADPSFDNETIDGEPISPTVRTSNCKTVIAHLKAVTALAVSGDGETLASFGEGEGVKLWHLPSKAHMETLRDTVSLGVQRMAFSPDGMTLFIGTEHGKILVKDLSADGKGMIQLVRHTRAIRALSLSADGALLASASVAGDVVIGDTKLSERSYPLEESRSSATCLAISPGQELLIVGRVNGNADILFFPDGDPVGQLVTDGSSVDAAGFSPDGRKIALASRSSLEIWDAAKRELRKETAAPTTGHMVFTPDGDALASTERDVVKVRSARNLATMFTFRGHEGKLTALIAAKDMLISAGDDGTIRLWSWPQGESLGCLLDLKCTPSFAKGAQYKGHSEFGRVVTYTLPCGSPIPPGATCVCDCVPGTMPMPQVPKNHKRRVVGSVCTCDTVCTCNTVCSCVSHVSGGGGGGGTYWYPN